MEKILISVLDHDLGLTVRDLYTIDISVRT